METCVFVEGVKAGDCASWVQAWGSVAAILVSGLIAGWQIWAANRTAWRARRDQKRAMAEAAAALARQFALQINSLQAELAHSAFYIAGRSRSATFDPFRSLEASVLALPLHEMPDLESMRLLIGFRNLIGTTDAAFKRLVTMLEDPLQATEVKAGVVGHLVSAADTNDQKWKTLVEQLPRR